MDDSIFGIILLVAFYLIGLIIKDNFIKNISFTISIFIAGLLYKEPIINQSIKAIEVYRGNTELKIKYTIVDNDTVGRDSVVVLKK